MYRCFMWGLVREYVGATAALALATAACAPETSFRVTGEPGDPTVAYSQSETAINVSVVTSPGGTTDEVITITFNDQNQLVSYPDEFSREVFRGASALGWAWSEDRGATWMHVPPIDPPPGWAVLWGDPAIAHASLDPSYVFISNVAVPDSKFPQVGPIDGPLGGYLGGACIARSTDAGKTFANYGCVSHNEHFYDGGALAVGNFHVFAAYWDYTDGQTDVWRGSAFGDEPGFQLLPRPFVGLPVSAHPRLVFDYLNRLWVTTAVGTGPSAILAVSMWDGVAWTSPKDAAPGATLDPRADVPMGNGFVLRSSPEFSFDVGQAVSPDGLLQGEARFVFTRFDPTTNHHFLQGSRCSFFLETCEVVPAWRTSPTFSDQFHPVISFGGTRIIGSQTEPNWTVSYYDRLEPDAATIAVRAGRFAVLPSGAPTFVPRTLIESRPVCQDRRGYWGDYDDLKPLPRQSLAGPTTYIRAFSDSTPQCNQQWDYTQDPLHVSALLFE